MTPNELTELVDQIADAVADRLANRSRLVDRHGLATQLNVSVPTIDRLRREKRITPVMIGTRPMFDVEAVVSELRGV